LAIPSGDAGKAVRDVLDGDVAWRWREQVEAAAR
jgi:hypothetical protein